MNTNFENLPSLNSYLASSIENIIHHAEDKQTEINNLIQVMRQNEELLMPTTTHPRDLVQYLKLADTIRNLTKADGSESYPTLDNVTRAATVRFTHLGKQDTAFSIKIIQQLNHVSRETYLQTLAGWIAENKIGLKSLNLTQAEMLELAPHLTYLDLSDKQSMIHDIEFDGILLENTEKLTTLNISSLIALSMLKNTQHLQDLDVIFDITNPRAYNEFMGFLLPIYFDDPIRALKLAEPYEIDERDFLVTYFQFQVKYLDSSLASEIRRRVDEITPEKLRPMLRRNDIPFVHEDLLKADPLQRLYIYQLCSKLPSEQLPRLKELLTPIIKSPMKEPLLKFYQILTAVGFGSDEDVKLICKNWSNLEKTGQSQNFLNMSRSWDSVQTASMLATENLFFETTEDNIKRFTQLGVLEQEYSQFVDEAFLLYKPQAESWTEKLEYISNKPLGQAFIKLHFHAMAKDPRLQEIVLKAFPPDKPENRVLYPMVSSELGGILELHVVPTLPVADAPRLLKHIVSEGIINFLKVKYYGKPSIDCEEQFVTEVLQGYVINQSNHLFIRSASEGMYPYDLTQMLGSKGNSESYKDLGRFLGMALGWQLPTGKVLSEKLLGCMFSFQEADLDDASYDVDAFVAKMDSAAFIKFMKVATEDAGGSVKLYEKIFLSTPEEILNAASILNRFLKEDEVDDWIAGGVDNIKYIQDRFRAKWIADHSYSLNAAYAIAQGMKERMPASIWDFGPARWDELRKITPDKLSQILQRESELDHEIRLKINPYITNAGPDVRVIRNNLFNLAKTGHLEAFMNKFPARPMAHGLYPFLRYNNLFTESKEDNETMLAFIENVQPYLTASLYADSGDQNRILKNLINLNKTGHFEALAPIKLNEKTVGLLSEENFFTEDGKANVAKLKSMRYLKYASKRERIPLLKNVGILLKTGHYELFLEKFPPDKDTASILATEGLFTENGEENARAVLQLTDLQTEFSNLKNVIPIPEMPWAKEAENLAQTAVGKAFIRLHLSDIVKEATLQDIVLRTFPPGNPNNVKLYPLTTKRIGNTFEIEVVPTLPVADASDLLKIILATIGINKLKISYYGSPGVDASGLGRQFVSELMQGYVVNQGSLFIRLAGGGMYPYDPTHKKEKDNLVHYHDYNILGSFLGLALQLGYPTGQVLSEKAINCMLAFSAMDLNEIFDIKKFFAKMNNLDFIQFMKESSNDDEGLVNLYEKVFLSIDPNRSFESAAEINKVFEDDMLSSLIAGGKGNIEEIRQYLRAVWIEDHSFSITALRAMAQGVKQRIPKKIGDMEISGWEDVRTMGTKEFSKHLQGELTPQYVKEHIHVRVIGDVTPEKLETADNVRKWTDEWIDANGDDPEKLGNFVQAFSGARAMTKDIYLDINLAYHTIVSHTCFYRADLPVGVKEEFVKLMWDEYALGNLKFDVT